MIYFMCGVDLTSCLFLADQVRAQLTVFETGDTTPEQVAVAAEHKREEERQLLVAQHAKKVWYMTLTRFPSLGFSLRLRLNSFLQEPSLVPHGKSLAVSLSVRKKQRTEEQPNKMGASAPSPMRDERTSQPAVLLPKNRSSGERTLARPGHPTIYKAAGTATTVAGSASSLAVRPSASFIKADPNVRLSLVQDIVKYWDLAASGALKPPKVSEEEMVMAEVFARGVKAVAECRWLEGLIS